MKWYLVRHAQTDWNRDNRLQGHTDLPLNAVGIEQAKRVGAVFAGRAITAVYASPLQRSVQTAQAILTQTSGVLHPEPDLREIGLGQWEGLTPTDIQAQHDGMFQRWQARPSQVAIPGGEPFAAFQARVRRALARIGDAHRETAEIVIVTHGGVIAQILADRLGSDYDRLLRQMALDNAGVSAIEECAQSSCVLWVNAMAHVADLIDVDGPCGGVTAVASS